MSPLSQVEKKNLHSTATDRIDCDSLKITKIIGMVPTNRMPCSPGKVMGIINFKGKTIPVLDLRMHLFGNFQILPEMICVMAGQKAGAADSLIFAALVDSEADVYELIHGNTN